MNAIIDAQGRRTPSRRTLGALTLRGAGRRPTARSIGIDNLRLARIARLAGAPQVRAPASTCCGKLGDAVRGGRAAVPRCTRGSRPTSASRARMAERDSGYRHRRADARGPRDSSAWSDLP